MTTASNNKQIEAINARFAQFSRDHPAAPPTPPPSPPQYYPPAPPNPNGGHMSNDKKGRWWKWLLIIPVAILVILFLIGTPTLNSSASVLSSVGDRISSGFDKVLSAIGIGEDRPTPSDDILKALQFEVPTQKCVPDSNGLVSFRVEGIMPGRKWSDSIALPMDGVNADTALGQLMNTVCHDPSFGATVAAGLAHATDGQMALVDYYEWLKPFKFEEVDEIAKDYMPAFKNGAFRDDLSVDETLDAIQKNKDWQEVASLINTALVNLNNMGIHSPQSEWNAHQVGRSDVGLPKVALNDRQENLPALVLGLTEKGQECPIFQIAFNVGDKRPEGVNLCNKPAVPVAHKIVPPAPGTAVHQPPSPEQPPVGPPPPWQPPNNPPWNPPQPNCETHPVSECFPVNPPGKSGPVLVEPGAPLAPTDGPPRDPVVPANPFRPGPESLPGAPITGNPTTDSGAMAPGATPVAPDVDRGDSGAGTPAPVDSAAETPAGSTGIGESSTPMG